MQPMGPRGNQEASQPGLSRYQIQPCKITTKVTRGGPSGPAIVRRGKEARPGTRRLPIVEGPSTMLRVNSFDKLTAWRSGQALSTIPQHARDKCSG